jgi:hypothetical protein
MICHTDLHWFKKSHIIIAWIDDRYQLCIVCEVLDNKKAETTKQVILTIVQAFQPPHVIWIENGLEFAGVLDDHLIFCHDDLIHMEVVDQFMDSLLMAGELLLVCSPRNGLESNV